MFLNPMDRDYLAKLDNLNRALLQANNVLNPAFQSVVVNNDISTNGQFNNAALGAGKTTFNLATGASDSSFKLRVKNGVGTTNNSEQARLILETDANGDIPCGILFKRGNSTFDGSLQFFTSNGSSMMTLNSAGNLELSGGYVSRTSEALRIPNDGAYISFYNASNTVRTGFIQATAGSNLAIMAEGGVTAIKFGVAGAFRALIDYAGNFYPVVDNSVSSLGQPSNRWSSVYAGTGAINTSDARQKTDVSALTQQMRAAAREMLPLIGTYQWLDSVKEKGADKARLHVGFTVQQAIAILEKHGINPFSMAFICHDEWPAEYENRLVNAGEKVTKLRIVQKQKTRTVKQPQDVVELINGKPVLMHKVVDVMEPVFDDLPVLHEDGSPVMLDEHTPMLHRVPAMETVQEPYEADAEPKYEKVLVREAGDCFAFRYDQLTLFMLSALAE